MAYLIILTLFFAPAYVWRFAIGPVPVNGLMVWQGIVWLIFLLWLWRSHHSKDFILYCRSIISRLQLTLMGLFLLAGIISLVVFGLSQAKLGSFIVWFVQPLGTYFLAGFVTWTQPNFRSRFRSAVYILVAVLGLIALVQYATRFSLPPAYWGNSNEPKRAIGLFAHPDMFGLFLAPLMAWLVPDVIRRFNRIKSNLIPLIAWLLGALGLLLSLSRGAWLGFLVAGVVGMIVMPRKKVWLTAAGAAVVLALVIVTVPNLRYRVILPFKGEKSSVARLSLWHTGREMIRDNPLIGKGLNGFDNNWYRYNTDPGLDHYNFPHNIILNFWVDTGLLGMISFVTLLLYGLWRGLKNRADLFQLGLALFIIALVVHGLIDIPYLKNDLALVFWLVWAVSLTAPRQTAVESQQNPFPASR